MITTARKTRGIHRRGTRAAQPAYTDVLQGTLYFVTDEFIIERAGLTGWESYSGAKDTPVTLAGTPDYITISGAGQVITRNPIDLTTDVSGILPAANVGAGGAVTQVQFNDAQIVAGDAGLTYNKTTDILSVTGGIKERSRTTPLGEWINPAFDAANFVGMGGGTWTVDSGDMIEYCYTLIGKVMFLSVYIATSSITGVVDYVKIIIPGGFLATDYSLSSGCSLLVGGIWEGGGELGITPGSNHILAFRDGRVAFPVSTNTTYVRFTALIPING